MKKIVLIVLSVIMAFGVAQAQEKMIVEKTDGTKIEFAVSDVARVYFDAPSIEVIDGHEVIDLGLSVKWATCNIGADTPEDYGDYYAWGETETKSEYSQSNSLWCNLNYVELQTQNVIDYNGNLTADYDAATKKWGSSWRMPTLGEFKELLENCSWEFTTRTHANGYSVNGFVVTGPNGNSIFLPAGGYFNGKDLRCRDEYGNFWSATADTYAYNAYDLHYNTEHGWTTYYDRCYGNNVRPVYDGTSHQGGDDDAIDITEHISAMYVGGTIKMVNSLVQYGSVINWQFTNNSPHPVHLDSVQLVDGETGEAGNVMSADVDVEGGSSITYYTTIGLLGIHCPVTCRFKYTYKGKEYTVEAVYSRTR